MLALDVSDDLQRSTDILDGDDPTVAARLGRARVRGNRQPAAFRRRMTMYREGGRMEQTQIGKPYHECPTRLATARKVGHGLMPVGGEKEISQQVSGRVSANFLFAYQPPDLQRTTSVRIGRFRQLDCARSHVPRSTGVGWARIAESIDVPFPRRAARSL